MDKWDYSNLGDNNLKQRRHSRKSLLCLNFVNNLLNLTAFVIQKFYFFDLRRKIRNTNFSSFIPAFYNAFSFISRADLCYI